MTKTAATKRAEFAREYDQMVRDPMYACYAARAAVRPGARPSTKAAYVARRCEELGGE